MGLTVLTVALGGAQALATQRSHLEHGALFVPVPDPAPDPMAEVTVRIEGGGKHVELTARVIQVVPGAGIALAFDDSVDAKPRVEAVLAAAEEARSVAEDEATTVVWGRPRVAPAKGDDDEGPGTLHHRIRMMSTSEKRHLAAHGDRAARLILMRDTNKTLHSFVIQNPGITLDEVRFMAGYVQCNPDVLKRIAQNRDWVQNPRIVSALVRNPKTPTQLAIRLLDKVQFSELRAISKSNSVPRAVQAAARRKITR